VITKKSDQEVYQQEIVRGIGVKEKGVAEFAKAMEVLLEKMNDNKPMYVKPMYLRAKIEGEEIGRVLVNNGTTVNILPLSMLKVIEKIMEDLTPTRVEISGFSGKILQAKGMIGVNLKVGSLVALTMFFVVDAIPSYNVLLGNDWIYENG